MIARETESRRLSERKIRFKVFVISFGKKVCYNNFVREKEAI